MPVHRTNALTRLGVQAALAAVDAIAEQVAAARAAHDVAHLERAVWCAADTHPAVAHFQVGAVCLEKLGAQVEQLLANVSHGGRDGAAHRECGTTGARLLIVGCDVGIDVRN